MPKKVAKPHTQRKRVNQPAFFVVNNTQRIWQLQLSYKKQKQLSFTLRRFKTQPSRRSAKFKQKVYELPNFTGYREAAISFKHLRRQRRYRQNPDLKRWSLKFAPAAIVALGIVGTVYFGFNLKQPVNLAPAHAYAASSKPTKPEVAAPAHLAPSQPGRIQIPKIALDTAVVPTGLDANGAIQVPNDSWVTGWYDKSPTPGEVGPAVIVGHVDNLQGIAVFWRLRELAPGDTVSIARADGSTANFAITQIVEYPQDQFPTQEVYGNIDYAGLRLITCGGTFNTTTHHYSHNTVVYAKLIV
jgi:sortase (surface protein transpeptidase)